MAYKITPKAKPLAEKQALQQAASSVKGPLDPAPEPARATTEGGLASASDRRRSVGKRAGLNRGRIARFVLDQDEDLSTNFQALAGALGVGTRTVWHHFPGGPDDLRSEVSRHLLAGVARPFEPQESWDAYLSNLFRSTAAALSAQPRYAGVVAFTLAGSTLSHPRLLERLLTLLGGADIPEKLVPVGLKLLLSQFAALALAVGVPERTPAAGAQLDPDEYPKLIRFGPWHYEPGDHAEQIRQAADFLATASIIMLQHMQTDSTER